MSVATEISRLQADRNAIRAKLVELGMATSTDNLSKLAQAIEDIVNQGAVSVTVQEGDTYTIPKGYHNGSGTVSGVSGGGNYSLQSKTVTPTKKQQNVTPDSGYYGLSDVTVSPIPEAYQDVSSVTAASGDVLVGKVFVTADGTVTTGTMANNSAADVTLTATSITYTIPKGYHSGAGTVKIVLEEKTVTPTKAVQTITPESGNVLSKVTVNAIPDNYQDVSSVTATADKVLEDSVFVSPIGRVTQGAMPDNGAVDQTLTPANSSYTVPEGYHSGEGAVKIELEEKTVTPSAAGETVTPTSGKVLSKVSVAPIPKEYQDITVVTAAKGDVLEGKMFVTSAGDALYGTMANNGDTSKTIDGLTTTSVSIPAGYTTGGTVSLTDDIEEALAAI